MTGDACTAVALPIQAHTQSLSAPPQRVLPVRYPTKQTTTHRHRQYWQVSHGDSELRSPSAGTMTAQSILEGFNHLLGQTEVLALKRAVIE
jgi:hypothetical protein